MFIEKLIKSIKFHNKKYVMKEVQKLGFNLSNASKRLRDDKEVVLEAVKQDGNALQYASDRLKDDFEVVLEAVKNHYEAFLYASERWKYSKDIVMVAVRIGVAKTMQPKKIILDVKNEFGLKNSKNIKKRR